MKKLPRLYPEGPGKGYIEYIGLSRRFRNRTGNKSSVKAFEQKFAKWLGVKHAVAVGSARAGLYLLLKHFNIGPGDEVIVPAYTCPVVPAVVSGAGAVPVYADIRINDHNMDADTVAAKITHRTKAVIATHIEGFPCAIDAIMAVCKPRGIFVIEDAAQALGAEINGKKAGSLGKAGYFSFAYGKQLNTMGGGMVTTDDDSIVSELRAAVRNFKPPTRKSVFKRIALQAALDIFLRSPMFDLFIFPLITACSHLTPFDLINILFEDKGDFRGIERARVRFSGFQAYLGIIQLNRLDSANAKRRINAKFLINRLPAAIRRPVADKGAAAVYCYFPVEVENRRRVRRLLLDEGIDTQETWNRNCCAAHSCPNSTEIERTTLYLPVYSRLGKKELGYISQKLQRLFKEYESSFN